MRVLRPFLLLLLTCSSWAALAEENIEQGAAADNTNVPSPLAGASSVNLGMLTSALAGARYLAPGEGFAGAQLGDRLDILVSDWGRPRQLRQRGLTRRTSELSYRLDDFTLVQFRGRQRLEAISVQGLPGSAVQTVEGARFGIEPQQLVQLYGYPPKGMRKGKMEYPTRGISFAFDSNGLRAIAVYPPEK
ncbi:MAG: hypothetical protein U9Q71_06095 [Pseudomonadota bacterium]|nr:hypothetical protein [Pseudomonadota bacterium]